jgi:protein-disulfide isomerase
MWNKLGKLALATLIFIFSVQYVVFAQETTPDPKKEIEELSPDQKALHEELKMIRDLLLQGQQPAIPQVNVRDVEIELGNNPFKGSDSAPLVIVEFSDYQCQFCARHTKETYPEIYKKYIDTGKLRYVIIDNPLPGHNLAMDAAEAAHCADEQGKFWEMHDEMMFNPESLNDLTSTASFIGLDIQKFESCMETKKYADKVASNLSLASRLNIPSVPGFVIASSDSDNPQKVKGISYIRGAKPFTLFQQEIDKALVNLSE